MSVNEKMVSKLLLAIEGSKGEPALKPALRVIQTEVAAEDVFVPDRASLLKRISDLRRMYRLGWLVRQETFTVGKLTDLDDAALLCLLKRMERASQCPVDDVSYEDADLIKTPCIAAI